MPKIIQNLREQLLAQAKKQLLEKGYDDMNLRDIAAACGVAVGTLYNYYPSKEMLAAGVMLEDWQIACAGMRAACADTDDLMTGCRAVYDGVAAYAAIYTSTWGGYARKNTMVPGYGERHNMLIAQLADILAGLLANCGIAADSFAVAFTAESLLWSALDPDVRFEQVGQIIGKYLE